MGGGEMPHKETGDCESPVLVTDRDVSVAVGGLGLGPPGAADAAAMEITGMAEEKTRRDSGASGLGSGLSAKFSELGSVMASMHSAVLGVAARVESIELADLAIAGLSGNEAAGNG